MRSKWIILALVITGCMTKAQTNPKEVDIKDIIESVAENLSEDYDLSELTEILVRFKKHPVNLNHTTPEELKLLVFLSPLQISNFFNHLKENGKLVNVLELQSIDAFDTKTVENLLPFVSISAGFADEKITLHNMLRLGEHDLMVRYAQVMEKQKGFEDLPGNHYVGTPERLQLRYRFSYGSIMSAALTIDKDAGEKIIGKPFDFLSGNISFFKLGPIKKLVLGDYNLQFGQGLTLWSGFTFGKGPDVTSIAKKDLGLRPYTSSNEYSFFRGISGNINLLAHVQITPFLSYRKLDASQSIDTEENIVQATINQTGLHRTPSEIKNHNALSQLIYGAVIQYTKNNTGFGFISYRTAFSNSFITQSAVYDQYSFTGKSLTNLGAYYNYTIKNIYLFGEAAKSVNSGFAYTSGALISLTPSVSTSLSYRNYAKNYHSFFNQSLAESSEATNEKGLYTGINITPSKHFTFSGYADFFSFPWLKYRVDAPSKGYELLSQIIYSPNKMFKVLLRFKTETKQQNTDSEVPVNFLDDVKKESYRLETNWQINKIWTVQNRAEVSQYHKGQPAPEFGYMLYQDLAYTPMFSRLSGNLRLAYFHTPSYNSRIYAYEDDILYSFAFGMYNGKGIRTYINLKYNLAKKLNIWARFAAFIYQDVETVGTYLDEIQGNKKSELKLQLRYQF